jgi:hypothetical protein
MIDDVAVATLPGAGPYSWPTDAALVDGSHTIKVEVTDGKNVQTQTIAVNVARGGNGGGGTGDGDGDGDGNGDGAGGSDSDDGNVLGGCNAAHDAGLALALLAFVPWRRRKKNHVS